MLHCGINVLDITPAAISSTHPWIAKHIIPHLVSGVSESLCTIAMNICGIVINPMYHTYLHMFVNSTFCETSKKKRIHYVKSIN